VLPSSLDIPSLDPARVPGWLGLDHVAIAVPAGALEAHVAAWRGLGFGEIHREDVRGTDQVREVLLAPGGCDTLGAVQLLEPLAETSPVARQIEQRGGRGGLVHVAYRVRDVAAAFAALRAQGQRIIDAAPRPGSRGTIVFFVHPKPVQAAAGLGCLVEIVQAATDDARDSGTGEAAGECRGARDAEAAQHG
jgi:methylmalonyl-CoA/ethylmalonyl-CoA epimerase